MSTKEKTKLEASHARLRRLAADMDKDTAAGRKRDGNEADTRRRARGQWAMEYDRINGRYLLRSVTDGSFGHFEGWSADGVTTKSEDDANAAFIVRAVNAHDELVSACAEVLEWFDAFEPDHEHSRARTRMGNAGMAAKLRAALVNAGVAV